MKARKLSKRNRTPVASRPTRRFERVKTVRVTFAKLGSTAERLRLRSGTTVKDLVKARGLHEFSIRLIDPSQRKAPRGNPVRLSTQLKDGDVVVAIRLPGFVAGSAGPHDHLDLEEYRRTMSPRDFNFFVNFVGADALGFREEDLEPC